MTSEIKDPSVPMKQLDEPRMMEWNPLFMTQQD